MDSNNNNNTYPPIRYSQEPSFHVKASIMAMLVIIVSTSIIYPSLSIHSCSWTGSHTMYYGWFSVSNPSSIALAYFDVMFCHLLEFLTISYTASIFNNFLFNNKLLTTYINIMRVNLVTWCNILFISTHFINFLSLIITQIGSFWWPVIGDCVSYPSNIYVPLNSINSFILTAILVAFNRIVTIILVHSARAKSSCYEIITLWFLRGIKVFGMVAMILGVITFFYYITGALSLGAYVITMFTQLIAVKTLTLYFYIMYKRVYRIYAASLCDGMHDYRARHYRHLFYDYFCAY